MVAVAIYAVAYAYQAGGLTATFVAGTLGIAVFQMFEPVVQHF
jgi:hypothetical protein